MGWWIKLAVNKHLFVKNPVSVFRSVFDFRNIISFFASLQMSAFAVKTPFFQPAFHFFDGLCCYKTSFAKVIKPVVCIDLLFDMLNGIITSLILFSLKIAANADSYCVCGFYTFFVKSVMFCVILIILWNAWLFQPLPLVLPAGISSFVEKCTKCSTSFAAFSAAFNSFTWKRAQIFASSTP